MEIGDAVSWVTVYRGQRRKHRGLIEEFVGGRIPRAQVRSGDDEGVKRVPLCWLLVEQDANESRKA